MINWIAAKTLYGQIDFGIVVSSIYEQKIVLKHFPVQAFIKGRQHYVLSSVPRNEQQCYRVAILRVPESYILNEYLPIRDSISWGIKNFVTDLAPRWLVNLTAAKLLGNALPATDVILSNAVVELVGSEEAISVEDFRAQAKLPAAAIKTYLDQLATNALPGGSWKCATVGTTPSLDEKATKTAGKTAKKATGTKKSAKATTSELPADDATAITPQYHLWPTVSILDTFSESLFNNLMAAAPLAYTEFSDAFATAAQEAATPLLIISGVEASLAKFDDLVDYPEAEQGPYEAGVAQATKFLHTLLTESTPLPGNPPLQITQTLLMTFPDMEDLIGRENVGDCLPTLEAEVAEKVKLAREALDTTEELLDDPDAEDLEDEDEDDEDEDFDASELDDEDLDDEFSETDAASDAARAASSKRFRKDNDDDDDDEEEEFGDVDKLLEKLLKKEERMYLKDPTIALYAEFMDTIEVLYGEKSLEYAHALVEKAKLMYFSRLLLTSEDPLDAALEIVVELAGKNSLEYGRVLDGFAELYALRKESQRANELSQKSLALRRDLLGTDHFDTAAGVRRLAEVAFIKRDYRRAEDLLKKSLLLFEKNKLTDHPEYATATYRLYSCYLGMEKFAKAEKTLPPALAAWRKLPESQRGGYIRALQDLGKMYFDNDLMEKCLPLLEEGLAATYNHTQGVRHPFYNVYTYSLARMYATLGRNADAEAVYQRSITELEKEFTKQSIYYAMGLNRFARLQLILNNPKAAKLLYQEANELILQTYGPDSSDYLRQLLLVCWASIQAQAYDDAEVSGLEICKLLKDAQDTIIAQNPELAKAPLANTLDPLFLVVAKLLIQIYQRTNQTEKLQTWQDKYQGAKTGFIISDFTVPQLLDWSMTYIVDSQHQIRPLIVREAMLITFQLLPAPRDEDVNTVLNFYIQSLLENQELQHDEINEKVPQLLTDLLVEAGIQPEDPPPPSNNKKRRK